MCQFRWASMSLCNLTITINGHRRPSSTAKHSANRTNASSRVESSAADRIDCEPWLAHRTVQHHIEQHCQPVECAPGKRPVWASSCELGAAGRRTTQRVMSLISPLSICLASPMAGSSALLESLCVQHAVCSSCSGGPMIESAARPSRPEQRQRSPAIMRMCVTCRCR